jgi:predicted glycosyltransferase
LINECDLLITTNNSTIAVEAMMLGKPVISLQSEDWSLQEDISVSNAVVSVNDVSELKNSIEKILLDKEYKNTLLNNSKKFLNTHFSNHGKASKNISKILT